MKPVTLPCQKGWWFTCMPSFKCLNGEHSSFIQYTDHLYRPGPTSTYRSYMFLHGKNLLDPQTHSSRSKPIDATRFWMTSSSRAPCRTFGTEPAGFIKGITFIQRSYVAKKITLYRYEHWDVGIKLVYP